MRRGTLILAALLASAAALSTGPAAAQESPELPARGTLEEGGAAQTPFTKGKGPGHDNSYLERYEEDYGYLKDPSKRQDPFDPLKYIPLDATGDAYLTLNAEIRFRYDNTDHKNMGIATGATRLAGGKVLYTPATGTSTNELYKQRYELGADLHLGDYFRAYADVYHGQQTGHDVGSTVPGNLRDDLAVENGFGEIHDNTATTETGFRFGRQQIYLGNDLQVRANVSTNLPSPVFDGFRAYRDWGFARVDAFAYNVVDFENGVLQDRDNAHTNLWGVYGITDLPRFSVAGADGKQSLDLFYFGWRSDPFANGKGSAIYDDAQLLTGAKIVAATGVGFASSQDHRDTFGLRYYGEVGSFDYDWQGAWQTGSYDGLNVEAWAFNTDTGYTFHGLPWKPRIGAHFDGASGGADTAKGTISTYQPMYPNTQYYVPNNEFAPTNFYDVAPRISVDPTPAIKAEYYYSFLWRYSQSDAIYTGAPWPGGNGQNNFAATVLAPGRTIGEQSDLRITWTITPHWLTLFEWGVFFPGSAIRAAGGRTTEFLDANLTFKF